MMNIHPPISSFIGREEEINSLRQMIASGARLITITGAGGIGKTRLAIETTALAAADFADGVYFIPLDGLTDPGQVLAKIANGVEVSESGSAPLFDDLVKTLANKHVLLCVDNWEHVLDAAPHMADLLAACSRLVLLATSRQALRLRGEHEFPLNPLANSISGDESLSFAMQLFVDRARAVKPGFHLDEANTPAVMEICTLLDGLPLAIELAAALCRLFSPQALLSRLQSSPIQQGPSAAMQLLAGGPRDLPERQQTLWAAIQWSYALLDSDEQRVFRWMGVFYGGCDLDAVQTVCETGQVNARPILDILLALVDKSLLRADPTDGEPRFYMLRTIQDFALEQLKASGELTEARERYASYYFNWVLHAGQYLNGSERGAWLKRLDQDYDHLRVVLGWCLEQTSPEMAYQLGGVLWRLWTARGSQTEGRHWISRILAKEGEVSESAKADMFNGAGGLAMQGGDYETARRYFLECLQLRTKINNTPGMSSVHHNLGQLAFYMNDDETALFHQQQSLQLDQELGDEAGVASGYLSIGMNFLRQAELTEAEKYAQQGLVISQKIGDRWLMGLAHTLLGDIANSLGHSHLVRIHAKEAQNLFDEIGDLYHLNNINLLRGFNELHGGNYPLAAELMMKYLIHKAEIGDKLGIANGIEALAYLASARSEMQRAARLWGAADAIRRSIHSMQTKFDQLDSEKYISVARAQLREKRFLAEMEIGAAMTLEDMMEYARQPLKDESGNRAGKTRGSTLPAGLTAREAEILQLLAQGLADAQIAEKLFISPRTVNAHLTSIYSKLGVNSRAAATRFAVENGLA